MPISDPNVAQTDPATPWTAPGQQPQYGPPRPPGSPLREDPAQQANGGASVPPPPPPRAAARTAGPSNRATVLLATAVATAVATMAALGVSAIDPFESAGAADTADTAAADTEPGAVQTAAGDAGDPATSEGMSVSEIAEQVAPSVASVQVSMAPTGLGGGARSGSGSAVILTEDGYILTNNHVVDGANEVRVTLANGSRHEATVVGTDPTSDLAVLKIDATDLPAATFAEDLPDVGDTVVAIGSPFGLDGSVTAGIVSALDRTLAGDGATLTGLIQTDAAINPGNSGGALVDGQGRIVGINTAIYSGSGANDGVGFAVPSTTATAVAEQLVESGEVVWPVLGIRGQDVEPAVAEAYGLGTDSGALVGEVEPGTGAAEAGLRSGDIIVGVEDQTITSMSELAAAIRDHEVGDTIAITIVRDGDELELEATLTAG